MSSVNSWNVFPCELLTKLHQFSHSQLHCTLPTFYRLWVTDWKRVDGSALLLCPKVSIKGVASWPTEGYLAQWQRLGYVPSPARSLEQKVCLGQLLLHTFLTETIQAGNINRHHALPVTPFSTYFPPVPQSPGHPRQFSVAHNAWLPALCHPWDVYCVGGQLGQRGPRCL